MGMKLGMLLIREGAISPQQLEEALRLQVLYGGRLGTNLIELNAISADTLAQWLSRTSGFPAAAEAMLEEAPLEVTQLLSSELAEKHECFPFRKEGRRLLLAMTNPADLAAVDAVSFKTGHRIVPYVVPELVLYFHLEKRYGIVRKLRYIRLSSRLEHGASPPVPAGIKREAQLPAMPPPPPLPVPPLPSMPARIPEDNFPSSLVPPVLKATSTVPPPSVLNGRVSSPSVPVVPAQRSTIPPRTAPASVAPASPPVPAVGGTTAPFGWDAPTVPPPAGPSPAAAPAMVPPAAGAVPPLQQAASALSSALSREEVGEALLRFSPDRIETMLLFVVKDGMALGWKGRGPGLDGDQISRLMLPLNVPSMFGQAIESRLPASGPVTPTDVHKHFYKALRREPPPTAAVVPVLVKDRAVNLIYVDSGARGELGDLTGALSELAAQVPAAYTRLLRESKRPPVRPR